LIPAFEMSPENLDRFVREIRAFRPRMLFGYPSSLSLIARHARQTGQSMDDLGTRVAFVTSERLYDDQRADIEGTFGCRVANGYGGRDSGFIAHQCPEGSLHITAEDILVEIVDPQGRVLPTGDMGEIIVTHLATGDFPFIRYRTGDLGVLGRAPCACGRGLPVLEELQGRVTDLVVAHNGTIMHGLALIYVIRDLGGIDRFKIIQESREHTRVLLQPGPGYDPATASAIVSGFKARLGPEVRVDVEVTDRIPAEQSGKFRYVVSKVAG
jgi:phenylacetate-CoA ligase